MGHHHHITMLPAKPAGGLIASIAADVLPDFVHRYEPNPRDTSPERGGLASRR